MFVRRPSVTHLTTAVVVLALFSIVIHQTTSHLPLLAGTPFGGRGAYPDNDSLESINNNTLGFGKVFVVGMPTRTDRRDGISLQAALSNIDVEFIDSSDGTGIPDKALPKTSNHERPGNPVVGSWRGHVDALREVVRRNLSSALIMEDDVDWDIRIRQQLQNFARSSRALTQPLYGSSDMYADPTYVMAGKRASQEPRQLDFDKLPRTIVPLTSPYGDDWDVLWIGHCGQIFPKAEDENVPKGRVVQQDDATAPQKRYLGPVLQPFEYAEKYPEHSRVVHHLRDGVCSLAYAVSQRGARGMLFEIGTKDFNAAFDLLLHWSCSGEFGRGYHRCLTVQPPLIQHHRAAGPAGKDSDISGHGDGFREKSMTQEIRWSVRMNTEVLIKGGTDYADQFPDV